MALLHCMTLSNIIEFHKNFQSDAIIQLNLSLFHFLMITPFNSWGHGKVLKRRYISKNQQSIVPQLSLSIKDRTCHFITCSQSEILDKIAIFTLRQIPCGYKQEPSTSPLYLSCSLSLGLATQVFLIWPTCIPITGHSFMVFIFCLPAL